MDETRRMMTTGRAVTVECCCGADLREVPLPADLAALSGRKVIWVHARNGDIYCYPEEPSSSEDAVATAEPVT